MSRLNEDIKARLDSIVEQRCLVLVGDANGADKAAQRHFHELGYQSVIVFCVEESCRNNVGDWEFQRVTPPHERKDLDFFSAKDRVMAKEADYGFMIWDTKSAGTVLNVGRLVSDNKIAVIYRVSDKRFIEIQGASDFESLMSGCPAKLRSKVENQLKSEGLLTGAQADLFPKETIDGSLQRKP